MANPFITINSPAADATVPTTFTTSGSFGGDLGKRATVSCSLSYPDNPSLAGMVNQCVVSWSCTFTGVPPTDSSWDATITASVGPANAHCPITIQ